LRLHIGFRRIRNILLYTSSDPACAGPPSPQGEGLDGAHTKQLDKLEFIILYICLDFHIKMPPEGGIYQ